jgi:hypothetical protein
MMAVSTNVLMQLNAEMGLSVKPLNEKRNQITEMNSYIGCSESRFLHPYPYGAVLP